MYNISILFQRFLFLISTDLCLKTMEEFSGLTIQTKASVTNGIEDISDIHVRTKTCSICDRLTSLNVHSNICQQTNITVVCMNRFQWSPQGGSAKNHALVYCDPFIYIPPMAGSLVGLVLHKGATRASGHYISIVKAKNMWYYCDDSHVTIISDIHRILHSREVYLLFYVKDSMY